MKCSRCGTELGELKKCPSCGTYCVDNRGDSGCEETEKRKKDVVLTIGIITSALLIVVLFGVMVNRFFLNNKDKEIEQVQNSMVEWVQESKVAEATETSNSSLVDIWDSLKNPFIRDCASGSWNKIGNTAANLAQGGKLTWQGGWAYYYKNNALYKVFDYDHDETKFICDADDAKSLNIIGDYIYYLSNEVIYKVRTDGNDKKILIENVSGDRFIIFGDSIFYVATQNISATSVQYVLYLYSENDDNRTQLAVSDSMPQYMGISNNSLYYFVSDNDIKSWIVIDASSKNEYIVSNYDDSLTDGARPKFICDDTLVCFEYPGSIYHPFRLRSVDLSTQLVYCNKSYNYIFDSFSLFNMFDDWFIFDTRIEGDNYYSSSYEYGICLLDEDAFQSDGVYTENIMITEKKAITSVYVFDHYLFYTIEDSSSIYRIDINNPKNSWTEL